MLIKLFKKIMDPVKNFIHQLNTDAHRLNKNIVGNSNGVRQVPLNQEIYQKPGGAPQPQPQAQAPQLPQATAPALHPMPDGSDPAAVAQPVTPARPNSGFAIDEKTTKEFIDRLTSVEKKIDRFFNLIEKRVVKNAKEVTIRIKLNEEKVDENSNTEQE
jgi:hypothetical protein